MEFFLWSFIVIAVQTRQNNKKVKAQNKLRRSFPTAFTASGTHLILGCPPPGVNLLTGFSGCVLLRLRQRSSDISSVNWGLQWHQESDESQRFIGCVCFQASGVSVHWNCEMRLDLGEGRGRNLILLFNPVISLTA